MIDTVIFDIGQVLIQYDWDRYLEDTFNDSIICQNVKNAFNQCDFWRKMDLGVLSIEQIQEMLQEVNIEFRDEIAYAFKNLRYSLIPVDYAIPWLLELKAHGIKVFYLSNYSLYTIQENPDFFRFMDYMDGGILSSEIHLLKSDISIYKELITRYSITPSKTVFIDDSIDNTRLAKQMGMYTIHFCNYEQGKKDLYNLLDLYK